MDLTEYARTLHLKDLYSYHRNSGALWPPRTALTLARADFAEDTNADLVATMGEWGDWHALPGRECVSRRIKLSFTRREDIDYSFWDEENFSEDREYEILRAAGYTDPVARAAATIRVFILRKEMLAVSMVDIEVETRIMGVTTNAFMGHIATLSNHSLSLYSALDQLTDECLWNLQSYAA